MPHPDSPGEFKAKTQEYSYRLLIGPGEQSEVLAYHWHPQDPGVHYPHLHIAQAPKIHFPTSRVSLEDFVYLLMRDYNVKPKLSHTQCQEILRKRRDPSAGPQDDRRGVPPPATQMVVKRKASQLLARPTDRSDAMGPDGDRKFVPKRGLSEIGWKSVFPIRLLDPACGRDLNGPLGRIQQNHLA